jgi:hypothetical protein
MGKIKFFFIIICLIACNKKESKKYSRMHAVVDSLKIEKSKNIVIYRINPNDCLNCLNGLANTINELSNKEITQVFFVKIDREIEKKSLNLAFFKATEKNKIIWSGHLFGEIGYALGFTDPVSTSHVYNYDRDTVLFSKNIKDLFTAEEFYTYFN